nr:putative ribonuclease H-like domain, reverse transcriptase, RNA-dependent DNA polymerase [Tanacetum cinerariifolium]
MEPFRCPVTILNTLDYLGMFEGKADEGFLVGYFINSKAFRVFNSRNRRVEENLHIKFLENKPNVVGRGLEWHFNIDSPTYFMNYEPVTAGNQTNNDAGRVPEWLFDIDSLTNSMNYGPATAGNQTNNDAVFRAQMIKMLVSMPALEETGIFDDVYDDREVGAEADTNNLELLTIISLIPIIRMHKDHHKKQIISDLNLTTQTRRMLNFCEENTMMDVKSTFLYGTIEEEVYMCQPLSFEDPHFPNKVYKVEKTLYGLHQAPRAWFQVTPKTSHLYDVKRIFKYLKGQPKLGIWYPRDSPFDLEAFFDNDYARASLDTKSTIGGCQFISKRCYGFKIKMLDYGFNFMNTKLYIDNESTACIVKNLVFHSKTKNIEIWHHFIRDSYEKKLIQVIKIHTYHNVADLLTKAFDIVFFLTSSMIHYALTVSPTIYASDIELFWATAKSKTINDVKRIHAKVDGKTMVISESSMRSDFHFNDEDDAQTRFESVSKQSYDLPLQEVNTSGTGEDSMEHQDALMDFVPPTPYDSSLSGGHTPRCDEVNVASVIPDVSVVGPSTNAVGPSINTAEDIFKDKMTTMADTLMAIRRKRTTSVVIHDEEEPRRATPPPTVQSQDKGKGKMVEPKPISKNHIKAQIQRDEEIALLPQNVLRIAAQSSFAVLYLLNLNWCSLGRDSNRVVLAFTSFFFLCISSVVIVTVLPNCSSSFLVE